MLAWMTGCEDTRILIRFGGYATELGGGSLCPSHLEMEMLPR